MASSDTDVGTGVGSKGWLQLAKDSYSASTNYFDTNYRARIEDALQMFHSKHPRSSKYNSEAYKYRSRIFRPKTRSVLRKHEAAAALAFFSNLDIVSVSPQDGDDPQQVASALINKELMNYRLTKTIPWFTTALGAFQDAMKTGLVCSYQYWEFKGGKRRDAAPTPPAPNVMGQEQDDGLGNMGGIEGREIDSATMPEQDVENPFGAMPAMEMPTMANPQGEMPEEEDEQVYEVEQDRPCIELIPIENVRFSPTADWQNVVETSPYLILERPMYVYKVREMAEESGWYMPSDGQFRNAIVGGSNASTKQYRQGSHTNPDDAREPVQDYDLVQVNLNFMDTEEGRVVYYTLKDQFLLSDPVTLKEFVWHGKMPVVIGFCVIDSHNTYPEGLIDLGKQLQMETNEVGNQRLDNVKLVLNKRWIVRRNANIDTDSLLRNVPGGVTMAGNVDSDVREVNWSDITSSSYQEQDRINVDFDELTGNFSQGSIMSNRKLNETVGGMKMLGQGANMLTEYTIRTFVETYIEPVLRQLMMLEQKYESDEMILAIAGRKAKLYQRFGMNAITDTLLDQELTLTINVGMGATDPDQRLQKFMGAVTTWVKLAPNLPPDADPAEVRKELFGLAGYRDSSRFFTGQADPRITMMQQELQKAAQENEQLKQRVTQGAMLERRHRILDSKDAKNREKEFALDVEADLQSERDRISRAMESLDTDVTRLKLVSEAERKSRAA